MKNFKLLLVAAVVFGAGSAFTTVSTAPGELVFDENLGDYIPKDTAPGRCVEASDVCTYIDNGSGPVPVNPGEMAEYDENP